MKPMEREELRELLAGLRDTSTSSVELTRGAKGTYQWSTKLYFDHQDPASQEKALDDIDEIDRRLRERYLTEGM